jgi:hypothetical protein
LFTTLSIIILIAFGLRDIECDLFLVLFVSSHLPSSVITSPQLIIN